MIKNKEFKKEKSQWKVNMRVKSKFIFNSFYQATDIKEEMYSSFSGSFKLLTHQIKI